MCFLGYWKAGLLAFFFFFCLGLLISEQLRCIVCSLDVLTAGLLEVRGTEICKDSLEASRESEGVFISAGGGSGSG